MHPTIYHTKKMMGKVKQERGILIFCDLHGHSRKKNSFMYGCNKAADGGFNSWTKVRLFPRLLAKLNPIFDINSCKFKVERSKYGTGRVVVWKTFEVTNSFTLENSFHGYDYGNEFKEFHPDDLIKLGRDIVMTFWQYNRILISIDNELKITKGWLKPKRLLEITGTSAKEMIKKNLEYIQNGRRNAPTNNLSSIERTTNVTNPSQSAQSSTNKSFRKTGSFSLSSKAYVSKTPEYTYKWPTTVLNQAATKLQAFVKMTLQRMKYTELQEQH